MEFFEESSNKLKPIAESHTPQEVKNHPAKCEIRNEVPIFKKFMFTTFLSLSETSSFVEYSSTLVLFLFKILGLK